MTIHRQLASPGPLPVIGLVLAVLAAAMCAPSAAHAAAPLGEPIVITPSSGCGLLTAYAAGTGLPAWSGPAPSCGSGAFTLGFNQGNTPPPAAPSHSSGVATAGNALLSAWVLTSVHDGARMGYQVIAPPGLTITKVEYDTSQLENIANGRGWIGFTYWNGGTAQVHPDGTAVDAAASGPLDTNYWGKPVCKVVTWPGEIDSTASRCTRPRRKARPLRRGRLWQLVGAGCPLDLEPPGGRVASACVGS